jgi:ammonia channel protein AmtB
LQLAFFYGGLVESTTVLNTLMMSYVCAAIVTVPISCIFPSCFMLKPLKVSPSFLCVNASELQLQFLFVGYSWAFGGSHPFRGDTSEFFMRNINLGVSRNYGTRIPHLAYIFYELQFAYAST